MTKLMKIAASAVQTEAPRFFWLSFGPSCLQSTEADDVCEFFISNASACRQRNERIDQREHQSHNQDSISPHICGSTLRAFKGGKRRRALVTKGLCRPTAGLGIPFARVAFGGICHVPNFIKNSLKVLL